MNSNRWIALLFFILMIVLGATLERMLYASGKLALITKVDATFAEAVNEGLDQQYAALGMYESNTMSNPHKKLAHCAIIDISGKEVQSLVIENNKRMVTSDINNKIHHTLLAKKGIKGDSLYSRWNKKLSEANISLHYALRIHIRKDKDYILSSGDSILFMAKNKKMPSLHAGISNEIEIEPFIRYSWFSVVRNASIGIIVIGEFILILFLGGGVFYFLTKKKQPYIFSVAPKKLALANLRYVNDVHQFYVDNRKVRVRPQFASLLLLFFQAPSYFVTKQEIILCFWTLEDVGVDDKVRRVISDLRKFFEKESVEILIEASKDGYRLTSPKVPFHRGKSVVRNFSQKISQFSHSFTLACLKQVATFGKKLINIYNQMKKYLKLGIFTLVVIASLFMYKEANQINTPNALLLSNVEALAADEIARTHCIGTGSVDCPINHVKVEYVFEFWLDE